MTTEEGRLESALDAYRTARDRLRAEAMDAAERFRAVQAELETLCNAVECLADQDPEYVTVEEVDCLETLNVAMRYALDPWKDLLLTTYQARRRRRHQSPAERLLGVDLPAIPAP